MVRHAAPVLISASALLLIPLLWMSGADDAAPLAMPLLGGNIIGSTLGRLRRILAPRRQEREQFDLLLNTSPVGIAIAREMRILFANPALARIFGYGEPQELLGRPILDLIAPPFREQIAERYRRRERGESDITAYEAVGQRRDGSQFPYFVQVVLVRLRDGPATIGFITDLSEQKRTEAALRDSEARIRAVVDTAVDGIITINENGIIDTVNPAALRIFGYTRGELIGQNVRMLMPEPDQGRHDQYVRNYLQTGRAKIIGIGREVLGRRRDGTVFPLHLGVSEMNVQGRRMFTGIIHDISERVAAEQALRDSEARMRAVVDTAVDGIITIDERGTIATVNPAALGLFGYSREEMIGQNVRMLMPEPDQSRHDQYVRNYLQTGRAKIIGIGREVLGLRKDGTVFPLHLGVSEMNVQGRRMFTGIIHDISERVAAEQALRESEHRLMVAFEAGHMGAWEWHIPSGKLTWSPNLATIHGLEPGSMAGTVEDARRAIYADDRDRVDATARRAIQDRQDYHVEYRIVDRDGRLRWVEVFGRPILDVAGRPQRIIGVAMDVAARKAAEEALRLSEVRFRTVIEQSPLAIQLITPDGYTRQANMAWEELWGAGREHLEGYNILQDPQVKARGILPELQKAFEGEHVVIGPMEYDPAEIGKPGRSRWTESIAYPVKDEAGNVREVVLIHQDVTERIQIEQERLDNLQREQALRAQAESAERRAAFLAEASRALAASLDYQTTLQQVARLSVPMLGDVCVVDIVEQGEIRRVAMAHTDPSRDEMLWELTRRFPARPDAPAGPSWVIRTGQPQLLSEISDDLLAAAARDEEHLGVLRSWNLRSAMVIPLIARGGTLGAITLISTESDRHYTDADIPLAEDLARRAAQAVDNARLYNDARAAREEAEAANRSKDEFLATVSHELRTPLNAILGWAQLLRTGQMDVQETAHGLETVERNARLQAQLIEDLLDVSRIISGKLRLDVRPIDLAPVMEAAIAAVRPAANARGIRLQRVLDPYAGPVSGDPDRLQQVVWNLLSNAIKFTPRDGRVQVRLERVNSHVEIIVADTGEGIAPEFLPHVFDRFCQADSTTTRAHAGLGLGLAIVRHLIELHGGTVHAASAGQGQGATFTVKLPLTLDHRQRDPATHVHPAANAPSPLRPDEVPSLQGLQVLVVDDEPDARRLIHSLLKQYGAQVTTAGSVGEAIQSIEAARPDVLISDIGMPGEDGFELIRRVREMEREHGGYLPAVALTAFARTGDRRRALLSGFQMHLAKPVEPAELSTVVANLAARSEKP